MKRITTLGNMNGRVYVHVSSSQIRDQFLSDAAQEGFTYTGSDTSDLYAINTDKTINPVGFIGHMAYQCVDTIEGKPLIKIRYDEYLGIISVLW